MSGQRFDYQAYTEGQRGGLSLYPHSGVVSGLIVSAAVDDDPTTDLLVSVTAGQARLDGQLCTLASNISGMIFRFTGLNLISGARTYDIWLNARRRVPALASAPGGPQAEDKYIKIIDYPGYHQVEDIFVYRNSAWVKFDAASQAKPAWGHNNLPLNEINPTIDNTATANANVSFSISPEKAVYHKTGYPVGLTSPGAAYLRQPCSIKLATLNIANGGAVTVVPYGDEVRLPY